MKTALLPITVVIMLSVYIYSCSSADDDSAPPSVIQTPTAESEVTTTQYTLTVSKTVGGSINNSGGSYNEGTTVTIIATPDQGYEFSGWTGTTQTSNEIMITISSDLNLTAVFNEIKPVTIAWTSNNCPWKANYEFKDSMIYISSEETANDAGLSNLKIILKPTIEGKNYDKITHETLGFDLHEYVESELELNSQNILFEIPEAKSAFRMDLKITLIGLFNGLECICVLDEDFSRPDDLYPNSKIEIPSNAIPDLNKFQSYNDKIPLPNAQSVFLSTIGADWFDGKGTWRDEKVRKPDVPIRLALIGKDVYPEDWETLRDILEILNLIAPNLDITYASNIEEITLPIHMLNCDATLNSYDDCKLSGPFGYFSNFPEYPPDRLFKNNPWGFIQVSNQGVNRHTLTHEIGHALGLFHWNIGGASMGYYFDQAPYLSKWDLMAISTIDNNLVKNGMNREEVRLALDLPMDAIWSGFLNDNFSLGSNPTDSIWSDLGEQMKIQSALARINCQQCMEGN